MKSFFKEAISTIKTSGTIKPSSKYLIKDCLKDIDFEKSKTIFEFGSGDGCITQELASRMCDNTELYSFETNPKFYTHCFDKFSTKNNVHLLNSSAFEFDDVLRESSVNQVDCIVSSLPLALFKKTEVKNLLNKAYKYLKSGGVFIQYQYSLREYRELRKTFDSVDIDLTLRNLPPAFIYECYKN